MDIDARIRRRLRRDATERLVLDYEALAPVTHVEEPTDRGPILERLLDHLDPVFEGEPPRNGYVWGPQGSGKSAVLTSLFEHLRRIPRHAESTIHTSTRAQDTTTPAFATVDVREADSEFAFYQAVLDDLVDESIPRHGIGTDRLRERLTARFADSESPAVVLVDHVDEPATPGRSEILAMLDPFSESVNWLAVGRDPPPKHGWVEDAAQTIEFKPYQEQVLVDLLMDRASAGLSRRALDHAHAQRIAKWADGNAHDALTGLFVAADAAAAAGRDHVTDADVDAATAAVPRPCVALGRVLALPTNRQAVLRELVRLDAADRTSVSATTDAIATSSRTELSTGTIKRFLYEMAESGILVREENRTAGRAGRPPSRLDMRFPATVFERLYDLRER